MLAGGVWPMHGATAARHMCQKLVLQLQWYTGMWYVEKLAAACVFA